MPTSQEIFEQLLDRIDGLIRIMDEADVDDDELDFFETLELYEEYEGLITLADCLAALDFNTAEGVQQAVNYIQWVTLDQPPPEGTPAAVLMDEIRQSANIALGHL